MQSAIFPLNAVTRPTRTVTLLGGHWQCPDDHWQSPRRALIVPSWPLTMHRRLPRILGSRLSLFQRLLTVAF